MRWSQRGEERQRHPRHRQQSAPSTGSPSLRRDPFHVQHPAKFVATLKSIQIDFGRSFQMEAVKRPFPAGRGSNSQRPREEWLSLHPRFEQVFGTSKVADEKKWRARPKKKRFGKVGGQWGNEAPARSPHRRGPLDRWFSRSVAIRCSAPSPLRSPDACCSVKDRSPHISPERRSCGQRKMESHGVIPTDCSSF